MHSSWRFEIINKNVLFLLAIRGKFRTSISFKWFCVHSHSNFKCWLLTSAASLLLKAWLSPWIQPRKANCYHSGAVGRREHQLLCGVDKEIEAFINLTTQESDNNYNDNVFAGENEVGSDKSSDKWWYTSEKTGFTPLRWSNILHVNIYLLRRVFCLSWPNLNHTVHRRVGCRYVHQRGHLSICNHSSSNFCISWAEQFN